ncbi:MAG TPA: multifunctional oxoglutarate decarboxylase/oxoglutarate dehydrogenase thiamine pyrophosphate-binding subunit/dihydrolipoyllysine-residue succinyltransferase subunit [Candidatus Dormibacteraeota bacterium]|nr:multifunctional oxoglutarate decarboxylase/oxoglutarate dehydrogenase thiamine pyrophosphate-binding subunit/dihydrolipoyllysine-residue succinyltransferase subunit [Candidatus Dormibacteraeota bacterium]
MEIQTDKVDAEVPAPVGGQVRRILVEPGTTVAVGTPIAEITPGPIAAAASPPAAAAAPAAAPAAEGASEPHTASPLTRLLARQRGVDLARLPAAGPAGWVPRRALEQAPAAAAPLPPGATATPIKGPDGALVAAMEQSLDVPTATSFRTLSVRTLDHRRRQLVGALQTAGRAEGKVSFTHLIAYAVVRAAQERPDFSTSFARIDGRPHRVTRPGVNLGLAVDLERPDGSRFLMVPVLRDAHRLDFAAFRQQYEELVRRTRAGKLAADDLQGATLTLTNPGGIGTVASVPRLMAGQAAIIAVGAITYPPGLAPADDQAAAALGVSRVMTLTSTYDHRIVQGAESGEYLRRVEALLQGADGFYEQVFQSLGLPLPALEAPAPARPRQPAPAAPAGTPDEELMYAVAAGMSLIKAHRTHGHLAATLDPLGSEPPGDPALEPASVQLTPRLMEAVPAWMMRVEVPGATLAEALPHMRATYCGTIAYEIEHISNHEQRVWLREQIESGALRTPRPADQQLGLLRRLAAVDAFERFLRKTYLGQKTFSIEGVDALVPMLDEAIELLARDGAAEVILGMPHRGRLNVIAHIVGRSYASMIAEFESGHYVGGATAGDVKYHFGAEGTYVTTQGRPVTVALTHNPSHLEVVDAVVEGRARAKQTHRRAQEVHQDTRIAVPILIHGDAAFTGLGVVSETLNLQGLAGYTTGGTIHIIANNQVGFTTDPSEGRSTRYASDIAKGYDLPIIHVNADDVEACLDAVRLAVAFRTTFGHDALIDLIGYRRSGHNETDEPAYTQPQMAERIRQHPPAATVYGAALAARRLLTAEEVEEERRTAYQRMVEAHAAVKARPELAPPDEPAPRLDDPPASTVETAVSSAVLHDLDGQLALVPDGFTMHPKLRRFFAQRPTAFQPGGRLLWAQAEALAWASLLVEGVPIRLTGQDTERGTFSQRHLVLHDVVTGQSHAPIQHLVQAKAPFELHNSPLSEMAVLGFEYGYGITAPNALVIWEAQYGDFVNNAQVIVDQFIVSGLAKWGQDSRLTVLLPHGYEGSGPEHSSARLERFLQLAAEGNIRVAVPTTAAQYFHLLRLQALVPTRRPLIIVGPKSLLRLGGAQSPVEELTHGAFHPVLDDPQAAARRERATRVVLCSGKLFYELRQHREAAGAGPAPATALVRLERLAPFPRAELAQVLDGYPVLAEVVWAQEEPANMGARAHVAAALPRQLAPGVACGYAGRPRRASPAEGSMAAHLAEQARVVAAAFGPLEALTG